MAEFKVGDRVAAVHNRNIYYTAGSVGTVVEVCYDGDYLVEFDRSHGVRVDFEGGTTWRVSEVTQEAEPAQSRRMEAHKEEYRARANDPATSKGKRKVNKYEEEVLAQLSLIGPSTGKEIASLSQQPLNCITPRFAPLRRKGLIKDSGVRRDKQIVWVLV